MIFLWISKKFDVLERKMSPLSIYYDVYLRNMLPKVAVQLFPQIYGLTAGGVTPPAVIIHHQDSAL